MVVFTIAVLAIIAAVDLALVLVAGMTAGGSMALTPGFWQAVTTNIPLLLGGAVVTGLVILLASLYRIASLGGGGGIVAQEMGGVLVDADTGDPHRRRLRHVVEEMALASGVPVPAIYVLEREPGINAFAAGYTPSDAAVAVTRGTLEKLNRDELQGVIAHEFSHLLNGDMRLNIRLMGALFGILVLGLAGRRVLSGMRFSSGSSNKRGGGVVAIVALALTVIGYIGFFFGRWIKAAVSRQREYLADASAVQFTRLPDGIAGALKKIAVHQEGSRLVTDSEEISHMLFGQGFAKGLFSTHPPLLDRIRRIQPGFDPAELQELEKATAKSLSGADRTPPAATKRSGFDVDGIIRDIGNPGWQQIVAAAALVAALPRELLLAAQSVEWAPEALLATLLDNDPEVRQRQLLVVARRLGAESEVQIRYLLRSAPTIAPNQRLPMLEIAFPALRRRPNEFLHKLLECVGEVVLADGRVDPFEYLLGKTIATHLRDAEAPQRAQVAGKRALDDLPDAQAVLLSVLASHGHTDAAEAEAAYDRGFAASGLNGRPPFTPLENWPSKLDEALDALDALKPADKERLLRAMLAVVLTDGEALPAEVELLRAAGAALHIPLPLTA